MADKAIVLGMIVFILCNVVYDWYPIGDLFENEAIKEKVWYCGQATAFLLYAFALWSLRKSFITEVLLAVVFGQMLDELVGDPLEPSAIEYIGTIALYLALRWKRKYYTR